jgi:hypothetical protein
MKMTNTPLKFKGPVLSALAIGILCAFSIRPAQAGYTVTLQQSGANVVATGSGSLDLNPLTTDNQFHLGPAGGLMNPSSGLIFTGTSPLIADYQGTITGPANFGSGGVILSNGGSSGSTVGLNSGSDVWVPFGYQSGNPLSDMATYNNATFASLGVTPGTYEWTWGTGVDQNFTLQIGPAAVPDSGSTLALLFLSLAALFGIGRLRAHRVA